jgi:hypothetical protein
MLRSTWKAPADEWPGSSPAQTLLTTGFRTDRSARFYETVAEGHVQIGRTTMVRAHQPGEAVFRSVLPEDVEWKVKAYPPGSVIVLPGDTYHFHWAKSGEYVTQVTAIGPLGLEYLDPHDDPRELGQKSAQ